MSKKQIHLADPRFAHLSSDPTFNALKRKERKVVIEKRFASALKGKGFTTDAPVDSRGRKTKRKEDTTLHHLYDFEDEEEKEKEESEGEEDSDEETTLNLDLARGGGNDVSSSDDDESGSEWELEEVKDEHEWGELDRDARRIEWASRRLAICNLDWDSLTAEDLYMLVSSFKPLGGRIEKLTIYLSDFGKEKLDKEDTLGPQIEVSDEEENEDEDFDDGTLKKNSKKSEVIRKYQVERLKYYYAILECDCEQTASVLYEKCDGVEYENSGLRLDLRFVPDEMKFDESRVKECIKDEEVQTDKYRPKEVSNNPLSLSAVKLTWEDTDVNRERKMKEAFEDESNMDNVAEALIADSDEEMDTMGRKDKLALLLGAGNEDEDGVEVEWEEDEDENTKKMEKKEKSGKNNWESYLEKRKVKRKERKAAIAEAKRKAKEPAGEEERKAKTKLPAESKKIVKEEAVVIDKRFNALFTDSSFAIDQSSSLVKNKTVLDRQSEVRRKRKATDKPQGLNEANLVNRLKKKSAKWQK